MREFKSDVRVTTTHITGTLRRLSVEVLDGEVGEITATMAELFVNSGNGSLN